MISHIIMYYIICDITLSQVDAAEKDLGMKILPKNAFLSCFNFDFLAALPREELHQFLIGLYGDYIIPSASTQLPRCCASPSSSLVRPTRGSTNTWCPMQRLRVFGYASAIACHRWTRRRRSSK